MKSRMNRSHILVLLLLVLHVGVLPAQDKEILSNWEEKQLPWQSSSTLQVTSNPLKTTDNPSQQCAKFVTTKNQWDKITYSFSQPIDFYKHPKFSFKVLPPANGGVVTMRFEDEHRKRSISRYLTCYAGRWNNLIADFTGEGAGLFSKLTIFIDFSETTAGREWFIDEISKEGTFKNQTIEIDPSNQHSFLGVTESNTEDRTTAIGHFSVGAKVIEGNWSDQPFNMSIFYKSGMYQLHIKNNSDEDYERILHFKNSKFDEFSGEIYTVFNTVVEDIEESNTFMLGDNTGVFVDIPAESNVVIKLGERKDCNGDRGGLALVDACGACAGGGTGLVPVKKEEDCHAIFEDLEDESDTLIFLSSGTGHRSSINLPNTLLGKVYEFEDAHGDVFNTGELTTENIEEFELLELQHGTYFLKVGNWLGEIRIK